MTVSNSKIFQEASDPWSWFSIIKQFIFVVNTIFNLFSAHVYCYFIFMYNNLYTNNQPF